MTDHVAGLEAPASSTSRLAELHRLCNEDYAKGKQQRSTPFLSPSYAPAVPGPVIELSDLDVAISVGQQLLDSDSVLALRDSVRLLLRALGAEPTVPAPAPRCPAAHPDDPDPCTGPVVVTVLDAYNAGANGCEHHGARLLASLKGGRVYPLGTSPERAAIRVFMAAAKASPFPWVEGPRTHPSQLSHDENRRRGESQ